MNRSIIVLLILVHQFLSVQSQTRIIDMHLHCYSPEVLAEERYDHYGVKGEQDLETHFQETYAAMKKYNIVKAVVSGMPGTVEYWMSNDTDNRLIQGLHFMHPDELKMNITEFETLIKSGKVKVLGELGPYYSGTTLSDAVWQPYLKICEKYDIPVAVHTGGGDPGGTYTWAPKSRLSLGDPYLIEDVLVNYPKLRIYMMHAGGEDWPERAIRLMAYYPQLYTDIAVMLWVEPNTQRYIKEFLKNIKEAGYLNRVMFGSDQMMWPYAIGKSIDFLNSIDFLTAQEKEAIFYNNAATFLKLKD
jgi:hypothetical protein